MDIYQTEKEIDFVFPILKEKKAKVYFSFNPNNLSADSIALLGFSEKQVQIWLNYRKNKTIYSLEDFKKIWIISDSVATLLAPYLVFPSPKLDEVIPTKKLPNFITYFKFDPNSIQRDSFLMLGFLSPDFDILEAYRKNTIIKNKADFYSLFPEKKELIKKILYYLVFENKKNAYFSIEINKASEENFQSFKGIGAVLSRKIIEYREKLGGFYQITQIKEVQGITDSLWQTFATYLQVDSIPLKRLDLNTASFKDLLRHPYIDYNLAGSLLNIRTQKGRFNQLEEIKLSKLMTDSLYQKLVYYLEIK